MDIQKKSDSRTEMRKAFYGFVSLLGSSVISAIGFIIIASNRWVNFEPACGIFIILFVQWQTLGLTIAKTGIEQVAFAIVIENEKAYLNPAKYVSHNTLPLSAIFSLVVIFVFSPWAAVVAFCTIMLDTYSLIVMADLNARQKFRTTAISNMLNYPIFFITIFTINHFRKLSVALTLAAFLLSSFIRWLWLTGNQAVKPDMKEAVCKANLKMGLQQALNYWLFRSDQIVLAVLGLTALHNESVPMYIFLAKFPELVSAVMVVVATVLAREMYLKFPMDYLSILAIAKRHALLIPVYAASMAALFYFYLKLWNGRDIPSRLAVPFLLNAMVVLLAISIIFSNLRQGHLQTLLRNYAIAALAALLLSLIVCFKLDLIVLAWLVPLQFAVFIIISFSLGWGNPKKLYE